MRLERGREAPFLLSDGRLGSPNNPHAAGMTVIGERP